jgi:signal transduction histidine kinase/ligand-binding sensor domain-containing protein/DNA-binding response OmpR family regulator
VIRFLFLTTALALVIYLVPTPCWSQFQPQNIVKHYSLKDGMSQAAVNCIVEDSESYMWFATEDGLNRFDGSNFKIFRYHQLYPGFIDNYIQSITRDRKGDLWISSRTGLLKFDPQRETFGIFQHQYEFGGLSSPNDVSDISDGSADNLWVAWYGVGFGAFDKAKESFTIYNTTSLPSLTSQTTVVIHEDKFGLLWVGSQDHGLNVFTVSNGKVIEKLNALSGEDKLPSPNVKCIVEDSRNNIWIGTSRGLVVYVRERNKFVDFSTDKAIGSKSIISLLEDSQDQLWIGTQGNGLCRVDLRQLTPESIEGMAFKKIENVNEFNISNKTIQYLYEDSRRNIWIGTFGDGVYMVSSEKEKFTRHQKVVYKGTTVSEVAFYGMCYDRDGNLWLGTDGNGIFRKKSLENGETNYVADGKPGSIKDNTILSAFCDSKGRVWFGTYAAGLFQFNKATGTFVHYPYRGINSARPGVHDVRVIYEDSRGNIWIGTNRGGLCLLDVPAVCYKTPETFGNVLRDGDIRSIAEDKSGNLWLGFYGDGVFRFNTQSNDLVSFFQVQEEKNLIDNRIVFALHFDIHDRLWIGTAGGGLFLYDVARDSLTTFSEIQGLSNNTVSGILLDRTSCWASTNSGLSRIDLEILSITNYLPIDGLQTGQFNPGSAMFNNIAGYMCFGGTQGLNIFYPAQIKEEFEAPSVKLTGFQLFNKPIGLSDSIDGEPLLSEVISRSSLISLDHEQSVMTFDFATLDYTYPEKNYYAYQLIGLDKEWNYVGHEHSATYRYLKPGKYEFRVKASNQPNRWEDEYTRIQLVVNPPLWKTNGAYLLYLITGGVLFFIFLKYGRKHLSLQKRLKIEKAQRKHERRMAMEKLTFFTEISHEFRTPLTLIMGPLEEMLSKENQTSPNARKLQMVHRNATKLLNLINKLIDYRKVESGNVILKVSESDIVSFVNELFQSFADLAGKRNVNYTFHSEVSSLDVWFDKEKLEMVINNILSNSFKYLGEGNEIRVHLSQQVSEKYPQGRAVVKIKDNGLGIPKKHLGSIFNWFYKGDNSGTMNSGIGLSLARKLVHLHKGDIYVESVEGKGSTFSVKVPLGKDHFSKEEVTFVEHQPVDQQLTLAEPIESDDTSHKKGQSNLLIIEDDEEIRQFLREYFENDYKVSEASNGDEGLGMANTLHPDLIISDIMMPGKDGIEVCKLIKESMRTSHIPVILLTAKTSLLHQKEGIETGADAYITKPFSPEILSATVNNLLQSRNSLMRFYRNLFIEKSNAERPPEGTTSPDQKFLQTVYEHLMLNLDKPDFNVAELADLLNMSRSLVYKKIKMLTGLSPVEYVRSLRMQEAAKLLRTQQYKVFEVVYMVGFSDLKYFRQCFAKEFGVSPSEYMKGSGQQANA